MQPKINPMVHNSPDESIGYISTTFLINGVHVSVKYVPISIISIPETLTLHTAVISARPIHPSPYTMSMICFCNHIMYHPWYCNASQDIMCSIYFDKCTLMPTKSRLHRRVIKSLYPLNDSDGALSWNLKTKWQVRPLHFCATSIISTHSFHLLMLFPRQLKSLCHSDAYPYLTSPLSSLLSLFFSSTVLTYIASPLTTPLPHPNH